MNCMPNTGQRRKGGRLLERGRYQCPPSKRTKSLTNEPTECGRPQSTAILSPKKYCAGSRKRKKTPRRIAHPAAALFLCLIMRFCSSARYLDRRVFATLIRGYPDHFSAGDQAVALVSPDDLVSGKAGCPNEKTQKIA